MTPMASGKPTDAACPTCKGPGFVLRATDGSVVACPTCRPAVHRTDLAKSVGLTPALLDWTAATLHRQQKAAWQKAEALLTPAPHGFLTLWAEPGRGKTGVAIAAVNRCLATGIPALFTRTQAMLEHLKDAFSIKDDEGAELSRRYRRVRDCAVLVLDEYDRFAGTDWEVARMSMLINDRNDRRADHLTILTTNANPQTFEPYIWSRLSADGCEVIQVGGKNGVDLRRLDKGA